MSVHWGDMDALGHVNNVIYFRYAETGRISYFDTVLGNDPALWGVNGPILADIQCQFLRQLRYPAQLEVGTRVARLGGKSLVVESGIFRAEEQEPVAKSRAVVVWFDYKAQKAVPVPEDVRARFIAYEPSSPES
jgi:acyl-CoA thioester hydrolase